MKMRFTLSLALKAFQLSKAEKLQEAPDVAGVINFIEISDF